MENVVKPLQTAADDRHNKLEVRLAAGLPEAVLGDSLRLWQVLTNLVGNALKFTEHGTVTLSVSVVDRGNDSPRIRFAVQDTGIGIPAANQAHIFEAFRQADGTTTRQFGGTGLGLTISARIINMMDGQIKLASTEGEGSTFSFTLPLASCQAPVAATPDVAPAADGDDRKLSGIRILLVEDNLVNAKLATHILQKAGADIKWAENGEEGVALWEKNSFDLILMDVQMPVMDGFAATARIRALEDAGRRIPIVALTAHALAGYKEKCLAANMDDFLTKPLKAKQLRDTILWWTKQPAEV